MYLRDKEKLFSILPNLHTKFNLKRRSEVRNIIRNIYLNEMINDWDTAPTFIYFPGMFLSMGLIIEKRIGLVTMDYVETTSMRGIWEEK